MKLPHQIHCLALFLQFLHKHILVCLHASQTFTMLHSHFPLSHCFLNAFSFKLFPEFAVLDLQKQMHSARLLSATHTSAALFTLLQYTHFPDSREFWQKPEEITTRSSRHIWEDNIKIHHKYTRWEDMG